MEKKAVKKTKKAKEKSAIKKYFEGIGRRKTSIARVRLFKQKDKEKIFLLNSKILNEYFTEKEHQEKVLAPLKLLDCSEEFKISAKVKGGGIASQSEAVRHGITRALILFDPDNRKKLKKAGFLKRDPRMKERKKFGLKRARRAPQWSKR